VGAVIPAGAVKSAMKKGSGDLGIYIEDQRQQRAGLFLRDVEYILHAEFHLTEKAGPEDSVTKFEQMFIRRASAGQCLHRPSIQSTPFSPFSTPSSYTTADPPSNPSDSIPVSASSTPIAPDAPASPSI